MHCHLLIPDLFPIDLLAADAGRDLYLPALETLLERKLSACLVRCRDGSVFMSCAQYYSAAGLAYCTHHTQRDTQHGSQRNKRNEMIAPLGAGVTQTNE